MLSAFSRMQHVLSTTTSASAVDVGRHEPVGLEQAGDALGVVLVHLAPEGAHDVATGHGGAAHGPPGYRCPSDVRYGCQPWRPQGRDGRQSSRLAIGTLVVVVLAAAGGSVDPAQEGCCGWTRALWGDDAENAPVQQIVSGDRVPLVDEALERQRLAHVVRPHRGRHHRRRPRLLAGPLRRRTARAVKIEPLPDPAKSGGRGAYRSPTSWLRPSTAGLAELARGPVDETIIACWVRLEDAVATAGVERLPSETPAELATRVLRELPVPEVATRRLLALYREARYSRHRARRGRR